MVKKLCSLLFILIVVAAFSIAAYADQDTENNGTASSVTLENVTDESHTAETEGSSEEDPGISLDIVISSGDIAETEQFLARITKPEGNITVFKKSYYICGQSDREDKTDLEVILTLFNPETHRYEEFRNTDGASRWGIGSFGLFGKEVILKEGTNRIKIIVYKKSEADRLKPGVNLQVNYFSITVRDESLGEKIKRIIINPVDVIKDLLR